MIIRRYDGVDQNRSAELTRNVNETLVPELEKLSGFAGYRLIEAGNGAFSSLSLFETPEQGKVDEDRRQLDSRREARDDDPQRAQDHERVVAPATAFWSPRNSTAPRSDEKGPDLPGPSLVAPCRPRCARAHVRWRVEHQTIGAPAFRNVTQRPRLTPKVGAASSDT